MATPATPLVSDNDDNNRVNAARSAALTPLPPATVTWTVRERDLREQPNRGRGAGFAQ